MPKTSPLVLDAMIVTGNTKAAVKAAGGGSSDLWTVPPQSIQFDPRDNVRPLDQARVRHIADLIKVNGYDRKKPLGCFVRKVGSKDLIFVYEGQHRYHGALLAIREGAQIDRLPIIIDEAKSVTRANLIYAGITNNDGEKLTPLQLAEKVVELQALGEENATICKRLNITDQTIRDVLLLAHAPATLHRLVRDKVVSSTLAIEEIRAHGAEKALERLTTAASKAKASGKTKITKKVLDTLVAPQKITGLQAKQLLQALQAILHDAAFGKLSPGTIAGVHAALTPHVGLLDLPQKKTKYPIHLPNSAGVFAECECIKSPLLKRTNSSPAQIYLAQPQEGVWIFSTSVRIGTGYSGGLPAMRKLTATFPTRGQAIRGAVTDITEHLERPSGRNAKETPSIRAWLNKLWQAPDPDWTEEMAREARN